MVEGFLMLIFVVGYLFIAFEHILTIDKLIPALITMGLLWIIVSMAGLPVFEINAESGTLEPSSLHPLLLEHLGKTAEIMVFLIGAMTIVEILDYFNAFAVVKSLIKTRSKRKLIWIITLLAFFMSAIIDNLTTTIIFVAIAQKLIPDKNLRLWYVGLIVIAANAGGAWSPIGDVTTTMLWIAGKITPINLIKTTFVPSLACAAVPALAMSLMPAFKGEVTGSLEDVKSKTDSVVSKWMLVIGLLAIIFVPVFKGVTGLPPYMGMAIALACVCLTAEVVSEGKFLMINVFNPKKPGGNPISHSLSKIELSSVLFFFGILMSVAALESTGVLFDVAQELNTAVPNKSVVIMIMGIISSVIDNVPLVAASIGMFTDAPDAPLWHELAFSAGTGGSLLVIGSAAGVVAMGMERISFFAYLKKISLLAFLGFLAGYLLMIL